jgi:hypothetical protein
MTLQEAWMVWYENKPIKSLPGPGEKPEELTAVLMKIHSAFHAGSIVEGYVGGLVSTAIHEWKAPFAQRWISWCALQFLESGGKLKDLKEEHDPPVAFYRDQLREKPELTADRLLQYLLEMRITYVTRGEDDKLTRAGFRSRRPVNAYQICEIYRITYPPEPECSVNVRRQLHSKQQRKTAHNRSRNHQSHAI